MTEPPRRRAPGPAPGPAPGTPPGPPPGTPPGASREGAAGHARRRLGGLAAYAAIAYAFAVVMLGTTLPTPLYENYQRAYGFGGLMTTVVFAVYALGVIAALLLVGRASDEVGRRPMLLAGAAFSAASAVVFLAAGSLWPLFLGRVLSGFSAGIFTGTATVAVVELAPPARRAHATLVATAANMLGLGLGPLVSGVLAEFAPHPLRTVFAVDLALVAVAGLGVWLLPETVPEPRWPPRTGPRVPGVPPGVRALFVPVAVAGFAGFATLGLFTSVMPAVARQLMGVGSQSVIGLVVFAVFAGSAAGQAAEPALGTARALPVGCAALTTGVALVTAGVGAEVFALLVAGGIVAGVGQGLGLRAGVNVVTAKSPPERRAEVTSALFVVCYVGISLPVVGVGALEDTAGLRTAGLVFGACVMVLAVACGVYLSRPAVRAAGHAAD